MKDFRAGESIFLERKDGGASATSCSRACRRGEVMPLAAVARLTGRAEHAARCGRVVVDSGLGPVRVMTTHLEYYSAEHRDAQIGRLGNPPGSMLRLTCASTSPAASVHERPSSAVLCGDFNLKPDDPLHRKILDAGFADAWQALHPGTPHPHTFKLYDKNEKPYCCDYVFVTPELAPRLRAIESTRKRRHPIISR